MKNHSFQRKGNCKNGEKNKAKNYSSKNRRQNRTKSAFWGRYTSQHCVKESSHGNAMIPQNDGESE